MCEKVSRLALIFMLSWRPFLCCKSSCIYRDKLLDKKDYRVTQSWKYCNFTALTNKLWIISTNLSIAVTLSQLSLSLFNLNYDYEPRLVIRSTHVLPVDFGMFKPLSKYQSLSSNNPTLSRTRPRQTPILMFKQSYLTQDSANPSMPYHQAKHVIFGPSLADPF